MNRRANASMEAIGGFAAVTTVGGVIGGVAAYVGGSVGLTQLAINFGREAWRVVRASRPLAKMGHAAKHLKDFQKYANLSEKEVAQILEFVRQTGTVVGTGSSGEKIFEKVVEIGSHQVLVKVLESTGGVIKTGFPIP